MDPTVASGNTCFYLCFDSIGIHSGDVYFLVVGKESILVEQVGLDSEERANYDTDTYITDPNEAGFKGDTGGSSYVSDDELESEASTTTTPVPILDIDEL
ncbi:uncharacterized protein A4U43_C04F27150 [Asparagus officinalis]|uniref:Uncharacterized protein n=1 Tax=Asparagus officinalis TaxID=4686 RepID=A0A5P1F3X5_ASPOF|nr:uncharacterized protein A4U43_C04F27150 [Asparagus officinalis]